MRSRHHWEATLMDFWNSMNNSTVPWNSDNTALCAADHSVSPQPDELKDGIFTFAQARTKVTSELIERSSISSWKRRFKKNGDTYRIYEVDHRLCKVVGVRMRRAILLVLERKEDIPVTAKSQLFFLVIELIGVPLVNTILQVSGTQLHNTSLAHCIVCSHPKSSFHPSPCIPKTLLYFPPPPTPGNHHAVVCVHELFFFLFYSFFSQPPYPTPSPNNFQPVLYLWFCFYFAWLVY